METKIFKKDIVLQMRRKSKGGQKAKVVTCIICIISNSPQQVYFHSDHELELKLDQSLTEIKILKNPNQIQNEYNIMVKVGGTKTFISTTYK